MHSQRYGRLKENGLFLWQKLMWRFVLSDMISTRPLREAEKLYKVMGERFERRKGWSYSVITPDEEFENMFGRKADKRRKLYNGMIKCQYYQYFK